MGTKLLMIYMESVQLPTLQVRKVQKDKSFPIVLLASVGLLVLLLKIGGEWLATYLIQQGWII